MTQGQPGMKVDREESPAFERSRSILREGPRAAASGLKTLVKEESLIGRVICSKDRVGNSHPSHETFLRGNFVRSNSPDHKIEKLHSYQKNLQTLS